MMRRMTGWLLGVVFLAPLVAAEENGVGGGAAADSKASAAEADKEAKKRHDEGVKKCLDEFRKAMREAKSVNEQSAAVRMLGDCEEKDPKIVAQIAGFLNAGPSADKEFLLPVTAAEALGRFRKDKVAAQALMAAAGTNKKNSSLLERVLLALGEVGFEGALPTLVDHLRDSDAAAAAAAARGLGELNVAAAIDPLLKILERLERDEKLFSETTPGGVNGNAGLAEANQDARKRAATIKPAIKEALRKITGEEYMSSKDYQKWWAEKRATFKVKGEDDGKSTAKDKKSK